MRIRESAYPHASVARMRVQTRVRRGRFEIKEPFGSQRCSRATVQTHPGTLPSPQLRAVTRCVVEHSDDGEEKPQRQQPTRNGVASRRLRGTTHDRHHSRSRRNKQDEEDHPGKLPGWRSFSSKTRCDSPTDISVSHPISLVTVPPLFPDQLKPCETWTSTNVAYGCHAEKVARILPRDQLSTEEILKSHSGGCG